MLVEVWVDGACRGQGLKDNAGASILGDGAIGVVIYQNHRLTGQFARGLGPTTNNASELEALLHAVLLCWAADLRDPVIHSDSAVVVNQVNGRWSCRTPELYPILHSINEVKKEFRFRLVQVPRTDPGIRQADRLCNLFLDELEAHKLTLPPPRKRRKKKPHPPGEEAPHDEEDRGDRGVHH